MTALSSPRLCLRLALFVALAASPAAAGANRQVCMSAYVDAQRLRMANKLQSARAAAIQCSADACAERLRADCVAWLAEIDQAIPTVVVTLVDSAGNERTDARLLVDDELAARKLDGVALAIDPGEHRLRVEATGEVPIEQRVVLLQGEHARPIRFELPRAAQTSPAPIPAAPPPTPAPAWTRPIPASAIVAASVAGVAFVTWGGFGYSGVYGNPGVRELDRCSPNGTVSFPTRRVA